LLCAVSFGVIFGFQCCINATKMLQYTGYAINALAYFGASGQRTQDGNVDKE